MKTILAKILLSFAVGLLFSHQLITHHHQEDVAIVSYDHHDEDADHHDKDHPDHDVAHIFSFNKSMPAVQETPMLYICSGKIGELIPAGCFDIKKREYIEIRPPLIKPGYFQYFSFRAPPSLA